MVKIALEKIARMRAFLETTGEVPHEDGSTFRGIGLDRPVLEKIYHANFRRVAGPGPRPVNVPLATNRCRELQALAEAGGADGETLTDLANIRQRLEAL